MKLLVLAQIPPPLHGQSAMVQTLVNGLPTVAPDIEVHHVNLSLSATPNDIGRWQLGKLWSAWRAARRAITVARRHGCDALYYVPAPGKRITLWRDLFILGQVRPIVPRLILHWHASGLGEWLETSATALERHLAHRVLGHAAVSIVLGQALRADAMRFHPAQTFVIRNGIKDPNPRAQLTTSRPPPLPLTALFLSQCSAAKGIFTTLAAVEIANRRQPGSVKLVVAGDFPDADTAAAFDRQVSLGTTTVHQTGFVAGEDKARLLAQADVLIFPTTYAAETQGLVVAEAMAFDLPVIVTHWRAVHENLPPEFSWIIPVGEHAADQIATSLGQLAASPAPHGKVRQHFVAHYTAQTFLRSVADALR